MSLAIDGFCDDRFVALRDAFIGNFNDGHELGASFALTHKGKLVVDLWGGYADLEKTRAWDKDTIVPVYSTTKMITAICALIVVDRGLLKLDETIAHYWPEFAAGGKDKVTVRDAFTHQTGAAGFASQLPRAVLADWPAITARIAAEPHWFDGRRVLCYHGSTYGFILGELMRRTDGRRPKQFFREEIAEKLGVDFQIGLSSQSEPSRVAALKDNSSGPRFPAGTLADKIWNSVEHSPPDWSQLSAGNPSVGGFGNGRSLAQVLAIVGSGGEVDAKRILSPQTIAEAGKEQVYAEDPFSGWLRFGLGFALDSKEFPAPSPASLHWGGYGGSWAIADPKAGISFGYTPNNLIVEVRDGNYQRDDRLYRFSAVLKDLFATL